MRNRGLYCSTTEAAVLGPLRCSGDSASEPGAKGEPSLLSIQAPTELSIQAFQGLSAEGRGVSAGRAM